jgi:peptide/nickel transport system substrate-binding protein
MIGCLARRAAIAAVLVLPGLGTLAQVPAGQQPASQLTAVMQADVRIMDPHTSTVYITRNFALMVYDTLFAMDSEGRIRPQMVERFTTSDDRLTWTFTLREGLTFHDGQPVTAADVVASLRRWGPGDGLGRHLMAATASLEPVDAQTVRLTLARPFGLVLDALGKPSSLVPAIMPERLAQRPRTEQNSELIGSGPFVFRRDLSVSGATQVFDRFRAYRPREEPADFLAGGKRVLVDRVTWRVIPDAATAANALTTGEIDFVEMPAFDLLPLLRRNRSVRVVPLAGPSMWQGFVRVNSAAGPFADPAVRRVLMMAVDQSEGPQALGATGDLSLPQCLSFWMCGGALETTVGSEVAARPDLARAREALRQTNYRGEPVVIMQATDIDAPRIGSEVVAARLRAIGFTVDLQAMDWGTVVARRARRDASWSLFGVHAQGFDLASPLTHFYIGTNCQDFTGWHCDQRLTPLLEQFAGAATIEDRRRIAAEIQTIAYDIVPAVVWGQFSQPIAYRTELEGVIPSGIPVFWNIRRPAR